MVLFVLYLKAEELENVESISLMEVEQQQQQAEQSSFCISVRNPLSEDETREKVIIVNNDLQQLASSSSSSAKDKKSREQDNNTQQQPACHFSLTWEGSKKASTLTVLSTAQVKTALKKKKSGSNKKLVLPRAYTSDDVGQYVPILAVECRGLEPYAFFPSSSNSECFVVVTAASQGTVFRGEDVDLSEGDWADYDTENDQPVSISDISFKWEAV